MDRLIRVKNRMRRLQHIATQSTPAVAFVVLSVASQAAYAQGGNMNFQTGMTTLATALLTIFGAIVLVVAAWKGVEAVIDHRSVMPSMLGLVFGLSLVFGGAWYLQQLGANAGAVANL
jgi:hypothetical protein